MIVSLPMYDRPETAPATDRFWDLTRKQLAQRGISAPEALDRSSDIGAAWNSDELLLSQTCSLPFRTKLAGKVRIVGTPDIRLKDCPPGYYCSVLIAGPGDSRSRIEEFDGAVLAYNDELSQSGWAAPIAHAERRGMSFGGYYRTGSHEESAEAVAQGLAQIAALDVHSWRLIRRFCPLASSLRVLGQTGFTPGLPLITAMGELTDLLFAAVSAAIEVADPSDLELLPFRGIARIPEDAYLSLPKPGRPSSPAVTASRQRRRR